MKNKGISLIVLVITIVVIIILTSAVILNVTKNNPIDSAKKAKFLSDMDNIKMELEIYVAKKHADTLGGYNRELLEATKDKVFENGVEDTSKNISDILTSIDGTKYEDKIQIVEGQIVYVGKDKDEIEWAGDKGIEVTAVKINVVNDTDEVSIKGKISVTGSLVEKEKIEKYEIYVAKKEEEYTNSPNKVILEKKAEVEYYIDGLVTGTEYKIKIELTMDQKKYIKEVTGITTINDTEAPDVESIKVVITSSTWRSVTIRLDNIPEDAIITEYAKPNSKTWIKYVGEFEILENGEVNIRVEDRAGNEAVKTVIIDKIDDKAANVSAISEQSKMKVGSSNNIEDYFSIDKNGEAPISSMTYKNLSNNEQIQNTSSLLPGSHIIECEVSKENGKVSKATTKISIIDYGTSISDFYDNIYCGTSSGTKPTLESNLHYTGNFYGRYLGEAETMLSHKDLHNGPEGYEDEVFDQNYIYAGDNYYPFEVESNLNKWIYVQISGSWSTVNREIGKFRLKYKDGNEYTLEDSLKNGYIEPLVLVGSNSKEETSLYKEVKNLISGGITDMVQYPHVQIYFKIKDKSTLVGVNLYTNGDFSKVFADGLRVYELIEEFEISTSPW